MGAYIGALLDCAAQEGRSVRLRIEKAGDSPWPAAVGVVQVWPTAGASGRFSLSSTDGHPVQAQTVLSAIGEPTLIRFNTGGGASAYYVDFSTNAAAAPGSWNPEAGVLLETRACAEQPLNTLEQVRRAANQAGPAYGRSYVPNVFLGMNPHGPSGRYVALWSGWFNAPRAGEYSFATASSDASCLEVDGHLVADWLGRHGPHGGLQGQHSGRIQLKPGVHHLDYLHVQLGGEPAAVAAWKPPGADRFEVIPASAFLPVARFQVSGVEPPPSAPNQTYFEWQTRDHFVLGDSPVVRVRFRVIQPAQRRTYKWQFDDADEADGAVVQHFFLQAGTRQVTLAAWDKGSCLASNSVRLRVHPNWLQREEWRPEVFNEAKNDLLKRNLGRAPARDLLDALDWADQLEDWQLLVPVADAILRRAEEFSAAAYGATFFKLGLSLQHQGDRGDGLAQAALRLALTPQRTSSAISERARLRLADLLIHASGALDEAGQLLEGLSGAGLAGEERRLWKLLQGDLLLARRDVQGARKLYATLGDATPKPGVHTALGRAARLESASIWLQCGEFDAAQHALDLLAFEAPLERLALDTALLRVQVSLKRKEFQRAFAASQALVPAAGHDPAKANLLCCVVESGLALGKSEPARRALQQLLKEFPFSEAAAMAKSMAR